MKLCFVSVNGPRETYLLDEPRTKKKSKYFSKAHPSTSSSFVMRFLRAEHFLSLSSDDAIVCLSLFADVSLPLIIQEIPPL
jgi:hypothetical protein